MIILGIDPSLNSTGYGIIKKEGSSLFYISSGVIAARKDDTFYEKLVNTSKALEDLILEFSPEKVGVEETFVNSNSKTSLKLGMARGAIILTLAKANLKIFEISPNLAKKNITGNGKAEKEQVAFMVGKLLCNIPQEKIFKTEDETDALAMAIACAHGNYNNLI